MKLPSLQLVWNFKTFTHQHNLTSNRIKQPYILIDARNSKAEKQSQPEMLVEQGRLKLNDGTKD